MFSNCGFTINLKKSVLVPIQVIEVLGFLLDSRNMTITLPEEKWEKCLTLGHSLTKRWVSLKVLARFIGVCISLKVVIPLVMCHYRAMERDKNRAITLNEGDKGNVSLLPLAREEIDWWLDQLEEQHISWCFDLPKPTETLFTDTMIKSWGAVCCEEAIPSFFHRKREA